MSKPLTVREAVAWATRALREAGVDVPRLEAELLLADLMGVERPYLVAHGDARLPPDVWAAYQHRVERRRRGEPLAYILGYRWFYGLKLQVTPDVLIPRPETETLVDLALAYLRAWPRPRPRVVDVGTGSGAIALALAAHARHAWVVGTDISPRALRVATANARTLSLPVGFVLADLLTPLVGPWDVIVANLPYVGTEEAHLLDPSVRAYEPPEALWAGAHGLDLIRRLLDQVPSRLAPDGLLLLEVGYRQGSAVQALVQQALPDAVVTVHRDLGGHERVVRARRGVKAR